MEALEGRNKLNAAVEQILERDEEFAERMRNVDDTIWVAETRSVRFYDNDSTIELAAQPTMTALGSGRRPVSQDWRASRTFTDRREFEAILEQSRVYSRSASNESEDISMSSSAVRSHAWSILSLNDISIIAVFRLPVTLNDINGLGAGLTFASLLQELTEEPVIGEAEDTATQTAKFSSTRLVPPVLSVQPALPVPPVQARLEALVEAGTETGTPLRPLAETASSKTETALVFK
jgi:hypothetical protein